MSVVGVVGEEEVAAEEAGAVVEAGSQRVEEGEEARWQRQLRRNKGRRKLEAVHCDAVLLPSRGERATLQQGRFEPGTDKTQMP